MPAAEINPDKVFLKIGVAFLNNSGIVFVYLICSFEYYMLFYQFLHCYLTAIPHPYNRFLRNIIQEVFFI